MYRNKSLLETARTAPCAGKIPGVCTGQGVVWAHSNLLIHGKGRGIKAHDYFGAHLCSSCHSYIDHGTASKEDKEYYFRRAMDNTWAYLWEHDIISVRGQIEKREKKYLPPSKIVPRKEM